MHHYQCKNTDKPFHFKFLLSAFATDIFELTMCFFHAWSSIIKLKVVNLAVAQLLLHAAKAFASLNVPLRGVCSSYIE